MKRVLKVTAIATLTLTVFLASPASARTFSSDTFIIDSDAVRWDGHRVDLGNGTPTTDGYSWTPTGSALMTYWDDGGHVGGNLTAIASHWGGSSCGSMNITWHYANAINGGSMTNTYMKLCNHTPEIDVDASSSSSRDLVRVEITFFDDSHDNYCDMSSTYGPPDDCRVLTFYVGDAPDSTGTRDQLDSDNVTLSTTSGATPFAGTIVYDVVLSADGGVEAHEKGSLRWSSGLGERARLYIHQTYGNRAATDTTIEFGRTNPTVDVNNYSATDVREITMYVISVPDGQPPVRVTPVVTRKFGDYGS